MTTTAIVEMKVDADGMDELLHLAQATMHIFDKQPGFISRKLLRSSQGEKLVQVIEWETVEDAQACMMSSDWKSPEAVAFMQFVQSGRASMSPENYETA